MNIQIAETGTNLNLPIDFELETSFKNPLFSKEEGSGTLPAMLPPTPENFAAFRFPNRVDTEKIQLTRRVRVQSGIYQRMGTATVLDASDDEGININVGFDEGEFWNTINNKKLNEFEWETVDYGSVENAIAVMNSLLTRQTVSNDLAVFEVMLDTAEKDGRIERYKINDIARLNGTWALKNQGVWNEHILVGNEWTSGTGIILPAGYGISPFLRVSALLEKMFFSLGYKVIENQFRKNGLERLVVLNNNRDSIVTGKLKYSDLAPSCTANELLDTLMAKFGAIPFVNSNDRTVSIRLVKDILTQPAQIDLTDFQNTKFKIHYEKGRQLKLSSEKNISSDHVLATAKTDRDTFEEFVDAYTNKFNIVNNTADVKATEPISTVFVFTRSTNQFYSWNLRQDGLTNLTVFSSGYFDWDQKHPDFDYEELKGVDEQVPMVQSNNTVFRLDIPAFLVGIRNLNTALRIKDKESAEEEKNGTECPLAFCWENTANSGVSFGTSFRAAPLQGGLSDIPFDLTYSGEYGLFNIFMKEYDIYLRHGLQKVESSYMLDEAIEQNLDITQLVMSHNQRFLIEEMKIKIGKQTPAQMTMRLATLGNFQYEYDFQLINQATKYWDFFNNINDIMAQTVNSFDVKNLPNRPNVYIYFGPWWNWSGGINQNAGSGVDFEPWYIMSYTKEIITEPSEMPLPLTFPNNTDFVVLGNYLFRITFRIKYRGIPGTYVAYGDYNGERVEYQITNTNRDNFLYESNYVIDNIQYQTGIVLKDIILT